jgi:trk system potassium uptake protein TrkA
MVEVNANGVDVNIVIMGCGRVGASLARGLDRNGAAVTVIDVDVDAFRRLGPDYQGRTVKGVGFDRDVLVRAGIRDADGFAAVSSGDNSNILAARVVREQFGIENVVARIYDHGRAQIYEKLGIPAVATVRWAAAQMLAQLMPQDSTPEWWDPSGRVVLARAQFDFGWIGARITEVEERTGTRVALMQRLGEGMVPGLDTVLQHGDVIYLSCRTEQLPVARGLLRTAPEGE